jgi:ribonuclease HII
MNLLSFDRNFYDTGLVFVAGIDEAGRGALAGPVTAAAVILSKDLIIPDLNDSKQVSKRKREQLFVIIKKKALAYGISSIDNTIVDKVNILQATFLAMSKSVLKLQIKPELCLIDGNHRIPNLAFKQEAIVGGDAKSACIAAASILAKVTRDKIMTDYAKQYPVYKFENHKGYATRQHIESLKQYGQCPIHRITFAPVSDICKNFKGRTEIMRK